MKIYDKKISVWYLVAFAIIVFALIKQCEPETKVKTVTKTEYVKVTDTITKTIISEPKKVFVERVKTVKGKDSLIYVNKPSTTTLNANEYNTRLLSNNATATLKITTTGELLDVSGTIDYTQENTTTTITKTRAMSGLFLYGDVPVTNYVNIEVGIIYQVRNTFLVKAGVQYNNITGKPDVKIGIGIKL
jgi:hypothetical protein